jgi:hypothetical protein
LKLAGDQFGVFGRLAKMPTVILRAMYCAMQL